MQNNENSPQIFRDKCASKPPMQLIDSHAHLDDKQYNNDRAAAIAEIRDSGVTNIINIGADMRSSRASAKLSNEHDFIYASVGVHPHYVNKITDENIAELRMLAANEKVVAIGEIGLDYYRNISPKDVQQLWFRKQLQLAKELNLPVIIHDRDAHEDCLNILKDENISNGVMHCYSGSAEMARTVVDMGFYISFGGVITFKNARVAVEALRAIPMDRLLIETDCPYLSPEPHRGMRNTGAYMPLIAQKVAEIKGISYEEACEITASNTRDLFGF